MESFYGGRQGASFSIVKTFDSVNPIDKYGYKYFAKYENNNDTENTYVLLKTKENESNKYEPIIQDNTNYSDYTWVEITCDGTFTIQIIQTDNNNVYGKVVPNSGQGTENIDYISINKVELEDLTTFLKKGSDTLNEVGYGEYVLIDTIKNLHEKNNPDNGKIFRRVFGEEPEYVGQIVGPQGEAPKLEIKNFQDLKNFQQNNSINSEDKGNVDYTTSNPLADLIPGYDGNEYNDKITFAWANIRDIHGNIQKCQIGFQIPTLIVDFEAESESAYYHRSDGEFNHVKNFTNNDLITKDTGENGYIEAENKWTHPFYQKWQIKIPKGIHGKNVENLRIYPTAFQPLGYRGRTLNDIKIYTTIDHITFNPISNNLLNTDDAAYPNIGTENNPIEIAIDDTYFKEHDNDFAKLDLQNNLNCYVEKKDCYKEKVYYTQIDYDKESEGEENLISISDKLFNEIKDVKLSEEGIITIYYSDGESKELENHLNFIQKMVITKQDDTINPSAPNDHLFVYYSDPNVRNNIPQENKKSYNGIEGWEDLGPVDREMDGLRIIKRYNSMSEFISEANTQLEQRGLLSLLPGGQRYNTEITDIEVIQYYRPEFIPIIGANNLPSIRDDRFGMCISIKNSSNIVQICAYDYNEEKWYSIGDLSSDTIDPLVTILESAPQYDTSDPEPKQVDKNKLNANGIWLMTSLKRCLN